MLEEERSIGGTTKRRSLRLQKVKWDKQALGSLASIYQAEGKLRAGPGVLLEGYAAPKTRRNSGRSSDRDARNQTAQWHAMRGSCFAISGSRARFHRVRGRDRERSRDLLFQWRCFVVDDD